MKDRVVSHYRLQEKIGQGGMGVVWRAEDLNLKRSVALKFLPQEMVPSDEQRQRFVREATAASALDHPNICTIYEIGTAPDGEMFMAMAYYEGQTLSSLIKRGPLPVQQVVNLASQIAEGLSKAHRQGIVHRDIKPANLMLTSDGLVKILDFGLARAGADPELTKTGQVIGTLAYMSPEQVRGERVDERSDIWSLGVIAYEMLAGRRPFGDNAAAAVLAIQSTTPDRVETLRPDVPDALALAVSTSLAKRVRDRYQRADELLRDLRRCPADSGSGIPDSPTVTRAELPSAPPVPSLPSAVPSVAILPFKNLSADPENEYFSDGLTDELIHALATIEGLRTVSRTSVFELKDKRLGLSEIGRVLQVDTVLEGSVRKSGNRVRIVARLVSAADDQQLWSERFDRELEDVFAVQDEIARSIADRLEVKLSTDAGTRRYKGSSEAYELYLKGRYFWNRRILDKTASCFEQALQIDADFALAHAGLASYHTAMAVYGGLDPREAWPLVRKSALRALELDHDLAEAHVAVGYLRTYEDWDWLGASREFLKAMELSPGLVDTRLAYAMHLNQTSRFEASWRQIHEAKERDPLSTLVKTFEIASYVYAGEHERALELGRLAEDMAPDALEVWLFCGMAHQGLEQYEAALRHLTRVHEMSGGSPVMAGFLGACLARAGEQDEARKHLDALVEAGTERYVPPTSRCFILAELGETEQAFEALGQAAEVRDSMLCYARVLPAFNPLRGDSRFDAMLTRVGLAAYD